MSAQVNSPSYQRAPFGNRHRARRLRLQWLYTFRAEVERKLHNVSLTSMYLDPIGEIIKDAR